MRFEDKLYQDSYLEYKKESAGGASKKNLINIISEGCKSFVINCNPFVGYLTVNQQQELKDKSVAFKSLNIEAAVFASAIGLGLGAYFVGQYLNGFDIGLNIMEKTQIGGYSGVAVEIPKYISFPLIWGGIFKNNYSNRISLFNSGVNNQNRSSITRKTSRLFDYRGNFICFWEKSTAQQVHETKRSRNRKGKRKH